MSVISNAEIKRTSTDGTAVIAGSLPVPTADTNGRDGWLYQKTSGIEKFNYYLWTQGSKALRLKDLRSIYMVASVDTYTNVTSAPFIVVYTKPTGVGDFDTWYHSRIAYTINEQTTNIMLGEKCQFYTHQSLPTDNYGLRQISLPIEIKDGEALLTEEILYITLHSDSSAPDNTKILVSDFGLETNHTEKISLRMKLNGN
tara:strand:- start:3653 stop:4252 length:600 start_codon:yes stop_codon:yes gene_type:complete